MTIFAINLLKEPMICGYGAKNHRDLQIPRVKLEYAKRSFYFSGVKNWNEIPDNIRKQESLAFKKHLRE